MTSQVDDNFTITDAVGQAEKLVACGFCALRWELNPDDTELAEQKRPLAALCEERQTLIEFVDLAQKNLISVFNHWAPRPMLHSMT